MKIAIILIIAFGASVAVFLYVRTVMLNREISFVPGAPFALRVGQAARYGDFEARFARVLADRRCPENVDCESSGGVYAEFDFTLGAREEKLYVEADRGGFFVIVPQEGESFTEAGWWEKYGVGKEGPYRVGEYVFLHDIGEYNFAITDVEPSRTSRKKIPSWRYKFTLLVAKAPE